MGDVTITLPDGTEITAESAFDAVQTYHGIEQSEPVAYLGNEEYTLSDYVKAYERKASSSNFSDIERAVYTDVAEKLDVLNRSGQLGESP